ncbi:MAG: serine acetyltransferase [Oscillospiraceae bacterium]|nr:serine acetyltransferase [Oscillospiraceae bacterium]
MYNDRTDKNLEDKLNVVVENILSDYTNDRDIDRYDGFVQPDKDVIVRMIEQLRNIVFPGFFKNKSYKVYTVRNNITMQLEDVLYNLIRQITIVLRYVEGCECLEGATAEECAEKIAFDYLATIPKIREYIETDVQAAFDGDPAAFNKDEIIYSYPGLYAIMVYRLAHELFTLGVPLIPRIMTEYAHSVTGVDIHPGATIGKYFFIDHGTGIVIGETTIIGDNVKVYQGVTLGALSTRGGQSLKNVKRHPTIEDNVTIYSGASILGGETVIGHDVVIGGNAFITTSIKAGARVSIKNQELSVNYGKKKTVELSEIEQDESWFYVI